MSQEKPKNVGRTERKRSAHLAPKFKGNRESMKVQSGQRPSDGPAWEAWPPSRHVILDKSLDHPGPSPPAL